MYIYEHYTWPYERERGGGGFVLKLCCPTSQELQETLKGIGPTLL